MKTITKRVCMAGLAAAFALALSTPAFAAATLTNGKVGDKNPANALDKAVTIEKELVVYNPDETTISEPYITYTYTLTSGTAGKEITDSTGVKAKTKAGILPSTTTATVQYRNSDITAAPDGASNKRTFQFDFSGVSYQAAGIYRYVITETTDVEKNVAGITDGTISNVRYLDVYVRDAREGETGRQIYGYVLFTNDNNIDGQSGASSNTETQAVKTTGFVAATDSDGSTALTADQYYTFNTTISKTLVNDSAMNTNKFPFSVDFTNATVTQNVLLKGSHTGSANEARPAASAASSLDCAPSIANGESVKYIGIPCGTTVAVYETNNVTGTTYKSSYKVDNGTASTGKNIGWTDADNKSDTATLNTAVGQKDTVAHTIAFTNELELISPTGVVMRYGPYVAMLVAGIAIFAMSRRNRAESEE